MCNGELEEPQDDSGVEITSLDEGKAAGLASGGVRGVAVRALALPTPARGVAIEKGRYEAERA